MRSIVFRFDDPQALALALDGASEGFFLPEGQAALAGEWVLALFEVGARRRSTASAARVLAGGEGEPLRVVVEKRDVERLRAFCLTKSEVLRAARPPSDAPPSSDRGPVSELPRPSFEVTLSGRFKAASISRVLIADTRASTEDQVKDALGALTVVVDVVTSVSAAIDYLSSMTVNLWIVGVELSDGSGFDAIRRAREELKIEMPVLVVTQAADSRLAIQAFAAGATDVISHPFRVSELAARTVTLLSHAGVRTP